MENILKPRMEFEGSVFVCREMLRGMIIFVAALLISLSAYHSRGREMTTGEQRREAGTTATIGKEESDWKHAFPFVAVSASITKITEKMIMPEQGVIPQIEMMEVPLSEIRAEEEKTKPVVNVPSVETPVEETSELLVISVYGNGGEPALITDTCKADTFAVDTLPVPSRLGKLFDGWYLDAACTIPFTGVDKTEELALYAGWKEFPGFLCDESGCITACTGTMEAVYDGLLRLPSYRECTGIASGALQGMETQVYEVCIPANITFIAPDAFDSLPNLLYIEVLEGNPVYYSDNGIVYRRDGTEIIYPQGRMK